jgi:uncharacterized protein YndB with AHSA1/START domain
MQEYVATAVIDASPNAVWDILVDADGYRRWNPEITAIYGAIDLGEKITAHVHIGAGVIRKVGMRVTGFAPPSRMEWTGGLPFGLFVGRRTFTVTPRGNGTEFRLHLEMSGPLSGPIGKSVGDRQPEVDSFAAALKKRAEQR